MNYNLESSYDFVIILLNNFNLDRICRDSYSIETVMTLGFVDNNFVLPDVNGSKQSTKLIKKDTESNLYQILLAKQSGENMWGMINIKSFQCLLESLNYIGFPFIKIINNESLGKKLYP